MKYAVIENGVVTNIVMWNGQQEGELNPFDGMNLVKIDDDQVGIGYMVVGGEFQPPKLTKNELINGAAEDKKSRLDHAMHITAMWRTELQLGIISDADKELLTAWIGYYKAVQAVDVETAPDIEWPDEPHPQ